MNLIISNTLDLGMTEEDFKRYFEKHPEILERLDKETDEILAKWEESKNGELI